MTNQDMLNQIAKNNGFIAALDQSGGSTPKALKAYGIEETAYKSEAEMFSLVHDMRSRIIKSPVFSGEHIIGAILFERTMDGEIDNIPTADYLWQKCGIVPFLKVDKGLAEETDGVQLMKPMPQLSELCQRAVSKNIFGTKMRSNILAANPVGIKANVEQQFEKGLQILANGLMPIIEPEVNINIADKAKAEDILRDEILTQLDKLPTNIQVMLKLTLPETANHYKPLVNHPRVLRVVALSGGYSRDDANARLKLNDEVIASFSRALTQGLSAQQSDQEFDSVLGQAITKIYGASYVAKNAA